MTDEYTQGLEKQLEEVQTKLAAAEGQLAKKRKKKEAVDPTNAEIKRWKLKYERAEDERAAVQREVIRLKCDYTKVSFLGFTWTRKIR